MKYLSLFAGIGGFELGIEQAIDKAQCVGYSETDKYATQIYERHFNHKRLGDITEIDPGDLPGFECMVGGFPCQSFSIAGKRGGFDDTKGTLFFEIARLAKQRQPRLLVLENVKGLLSHDEGKTFRTIINTLDELGYDCQWQVLNSKYHGVPQNRERVFIVGHLRGTARPKVFPIKGRSEAHLKEVTQGVSDGQRTYETSGASCTISGRGGGQGGKTGLYLVNDTDIRRLTPLECERLQGFPDGWTEHGVNESGNQIEISDTQRYKTVGNAVTVNVVKDIFDRL